MTDRSGDGGTGAVARVPRRPAALVAAAAVVVLVVLTAALGVRHHGRTVFVERQSATACQRIRSVSMPFGQIDSCRVLGRGVHDFGPVDAYVYVLVTTTSGLACVRVDYRRTGAGRQFTSTAVEVPASEAPALAGSDRVLVERDIRGRGGTARKPRTIHYGDG
jgi:hypothetical protein